MSKKARERKRLIRILKSEGLQTDPKSVKEWQRKLQSQYWQSELEHRIASRFHKRKKSIRKFYGFMGGYARYMSPGLFEHDPGYSGMSFCKLGGDVWQMR